MNLSSLNFPASPRGGNGIGGLLGSSAPCIKRSRSPRRSWFAAATSWAAAWLTLLSALPSSSLANQFVYPPPARTPTPPSRPPPTRPQTPPPPTSAPPPTLPLSPTPSPHPP